MTQATQNRKILTAFLVVLTGCGDTEPVAWQVDQDSASTPERAPLVPIQPPASDEPNASPDEADTPADAAPEPPAPVEPARHRCDDDQPYPVPDWPVARPEEHGMDHRALEHAADYAGANFSRCLVVIRSGSIVGEWYWGRNNGRRMDQDNPIKSWSVGKSYAATVTGLALDRGLIESLDDSIAQYIPAFEGTVKERISIHDVLSMSSGVRFDLNRDNAGMFFARNMTRLALRNPVTNPPGQLWEYNNHTVQLIEPILRQATGQAADEFAQTHLFEPLGMQATWQRDRSGNPAMYMNVSATCRDHAKFAYMYLRNGCWDGQEILSEDFHARALTPSTEMNRGYGYWWWLNGETPTLDSVDFSERGDVLQPFAPDDAYLAIGLGNQVVEVIPSLDMVIVRMGVAPQENLLYWLTDRPRILREMKNDGAHIVLDGVVRRVLASVRN